MSNIDATQEINKATGIIQIKCGLFPDIPIFVSLHKDLPHKDPNHSPHLIATRLSKIHHHPAGNMDDSRSSHNLLSSYDGIDIHGQCNVDNNVDNSINNTPIILGGNHFAIVDASHIISLDHIFVAIHTALIRTRTYRDTLHDTDNLNRVRGTALESIVCAAGSTHVPSILENYAFLSNSKKHEDGNAKDDTSDVILIGVNVSLDAFQQVLLDKDIGLASFPPETPANVSAYFSRPRSPDEITAFIKAYKTTREEVAMQGLEQAILHRVASKFYT